MALATDLVRKSAVSCVVLRSIWTGVSEKPGNQSEFG